MWVREWTGACDTNSIIPGIMLLFLSDLKKRLFVDELGDLAEGVPTAVFERMFHSMPDDARRHAMILESAANAAAISRERTWGEMQTLTMRHPLAVVPVLSDLLDLARGPWPWNGTPGTPNASFASADSQGSFRTVVGASWRFVIDFADVDAVSIVLPAGNSGNPMSEHFFDFFEKYHTGERWTVPFQYEKVKARAASVLVLEAEE
jgi:penicillin amidase